MELKDCIKGRKVTLMEKEGEIKSDTLYIFKFRE